MSGITNLLLDFRFALAGLRFRQQKVLGSVFFAIRQKVNAADHLTFGLDEGAAGVLGVEGVFGDAARR